MDKPNLDTNLETTGKLCTHIISGAIYFRMSGLASFSFKYNSMFYAHTKNKIFKKGKSGYCNQ